MTVDGLSTFSVDVTQVLWDLNTSLVELVDIRHRDDLSLVPFPHLNRLHGYLNIEISLSDPRCPSLN